MHGCHLAPPVEGVEMLYTCRSKFWVCGLAMTSKLHPLFQTVPGKEVGSHGSEVCRKVQNCLLCRWKHVSASCAEEQTEAHHTPSFVDVLQHACAVSLYGARTLC